MMTRVLTGGTPAACSTTNTAAGGSTSTTSTSNNNGAMTKWNSCPRHLYYDELAVRPRPPPNMHLYQKVSSGVVAIIALVVFLFVAPANSSLSLVRTVLDAIAGSVGLGVGMWSLLANKSVEFIVTDWVEPIGRLLGRICWYWIQVQYTVAQSLIDRIYEHYMLIWQSMWSLLLQQPIHLPAIGIDIGKTATSFAAEALETTNATLHGETTATTLLHGHPLHLHSSMTEIDYQSNLEMHRESMTNFNYNNQNINNNHSRDDADNFTYNSHSIYSTSMSSATGSTTPRPTTTRNGPQIQTQTTPTTPPSQTPLLSPDELYSPALTKPFSITTITTTTRKEKRHKLERTYPKYNA